MSFRISALHTVHCKASGIKSNKPQWIKGKMSGRAVNFSSSTILGHRTEGTGLSFVMIYGKVTSLLKLLQLQPFFTWSDWDLHNQSASWNPFGSQKPQMATYRTTVRSARDCLASIFFFFFPWEALQNTSHSEQLISSLPLHFQFLKNVRNVSRSPSPLWSDLKRLYGEAVLLFEGATFDSSSGV